MPKRGKRYRAALEHIDAQKQYSLEEASELVKKTNICNFEASVDMDVRLGVDPRHADQMVRGTVALPHGTGKSVRVLALVSPAKHEEAKEAGADHVGLDDYITKLEEGWTDVDVIVATPDVMGKIGKLGKVLGPRGLMPNPKSGTVTNEVADAIKEVKAGKIDFRVDRYGIIHTPVGRTGFSEQQIAENAKALLQSIIRLRPSSAKGTYVRGINMSATMGPGIPVHHSVAQTI